MPRSDWAERIHITVATISQAVRTSVKPTSAALKAFLACSISGVPDEIIYIMPAMKMATTEMVIKIPKPYLIRLFMPIIRWQSVQALPAELPLPQGTMPPLAAVVAGAEEVGC